MLSGLKVLSKHLSPKKNDTIRLCADSSAQSLQAVTEASVVTDGESMYEERALEHNQQSWSCEEGTSELGSHTKSSFASDSLVTEAEEMASCRLQLRYEQVVWKVAK